MNKLITEIKIQNCQKVLSLRKKYRKAIKKYKSKISTKYIKVKKYLISHYKYKMKPYSKNQAYIINEEIILDQILTTVNLWIKKSGFIQFLSSFKVKNDVKFPYDLREFNQYTNLEYYKNYGYTALDYLIGCIFYLGRCKALSYIAPYSNKNKCRLLTIVNDSSEEFKKSIKLGDEIVFKHPLRKQLFQEEVLGINWRHVTVRDKENNFIRIRWSAIYKAIIKL